MCNLRELGICSLKLHIKILNHYILFCFTVTNFYAIVFNELINKYLPLKEMKKRTITVK